MTRIQALLYKNLNSYDANFTSVAVIGGDVVRY